MPKWIWEIFIFVRRDMGWSSQQPAQSRRGDARFVQGALVAVEMWYLDVLIYKS